MILHGRNILVYQDGVAIAAAKACEIHVACQKLEVASPDTGEWEDYLPGRKGWQVRMSRLVTSETNGVTGHLMNVGQRVRLTFGSVDELKHLGFDRLTGYALCDDATVSAQTGSLAEGSFNFTGCGGLERVMVNLRDKNQNPLRDKDGNQLRVMENLENLI